MCMMQCACVGVCLFEDIYNNNLYPILAWFLLFSLKQFPHTIIKINHKIKYKPNFTPSCFLIHMQIKHMSLNEFSIHL